MQIDGPVGATIMGSSQGISPWGLICGVAVGIAPGVGVMVGVAKGLTGVGDCADAVTGHMAKMKMTR